MPLTVLLFWGVPIVSLSLYILLLAFLGISKKDASVRAMMWILGALALWTAGSLAMKMELFGHILLWNRVMVCGMFSVTFLIYRFVLIFTKTRRPKLLFLFGLATIAMLVLNLLGLVVPEGYNERLELIGTDGRTYYLPFFTYRLGVGAIVAYATFLLFVFYTLFFSRQITKHSLQAGRLRIVTTGMTIMFIGCVLNIFPALGAYPIDIFSALINAILLIFALYKHRMLDLKFMITRGATYVLIASMVTCGFIWAMLYYQKYLLSVLDEQQATHILIATAAMLSLLLHLLYGLVFRLTSKLFSRQEDQQRLALKNFSVEISNTLDLEQICKSLVETVARMVNAKHVSLLLQKEDMGCYGLYASSSRLASNTLSIKADNPIIHCLEERQEVLLLDDMDTMPQFRAVWDREKDALLWMGVEVIVPILCRGKLIGMLLLSHKKANTAYTLEDLDLLNTLGASSGVAIDNARRYAKAQTEAITDMITGLYNHRYFHMELERRMNELPDGPLSLLMLDLDNFKLYNDMFGHIQGDSALKEVAQILSRVIGQAGTPTRYGGEEFTVILPHCDVNRAYQFAEEIRSQVEAHFASKGNGMQRFLTVSIGICGYPDGAPNQQELLKRADFALYRAKNSGKNLVMIYSHSNNALQNGTLRKSPAELFAGMPHASTLFALTAAIDMKDRFTFSHSQNVAEYATALALEMGIDGAHAVLVREAALLHDIGKIGIPETLLAKRGLLTDEEFAVMQTHVERAIDILKHLPTTTHLVPIVLAHHEHWNGKGYPRGLKGEEIPLAARCLAVADAFDAMTSERPYKSAMSIDAALNELLEKAGTQFDPRAAYTFVQMVRRGAIKVKPYQPSLPVSQAGSQ